MAEPGRVRAALNDPGGAIERGLAARRASKSAAAGDGEDQGAAPAPAAAGPGRGARAKAGAAKAAKASAGYLSRGRWRPTLTPPTRARDTGSLLTGKLLYVGLITYIRYGTAGWKGWLSAKFLNKPIQGTASSPSDPDSDGWNGGLLTRKNLQIPQERKPT
ncbi:hypothetical protein [Kitasatospora sp. NPDC057198]|uniref:hypothetical protein n=1 Tax=Kitasatospora sp. NPDC057198 TaxID=3346046 RepID=UPI003640519C